MKHRMTKFNQLSKYDKIFRIINLCIMLISFLICVGLSIYYFCIGDPDSRALSSIGIAVVMILPWIGEMIFRRRLSNILFLAYQIYAIISGVVGSVFNLYNIVWWFDIFVHLLAGYVFSLVGIFIISRLQDYRKLNPWTIILFCFCLTLAIELVWELAEWTVSLIFKQPVQGEFVPEYGAALVTDTMEDILCNFIGGIIFAIHLIIGKFSKYNLGIKYYEKELVYVNDHKDYNQERTDNDIIDNKNTKLDETTIDKNNFKTDDVLNKNLKNTINENESSNEED